MASKVCDFCLGEAKGLFASMEHLQDGHYICRKCRKIIQSYDLPVRYDIFQCLVTAQKHMQGTIMGAFLETHNADECLARYFPLPSILLHEGEHCISAIPAVLTVDQDKVPAEDAVRTVNEIRRQTIHNISDASGSSTCKVEGTLYETEAALYFISDHIINCHRLGYIERNNDDDNHIIVNTPKKTYTYDVKHADLFFLRERFFQKVRAAMNNKQQSLIYIRNDNEYRITPGVYQIPKSLRPGRYQVTPLNDAGLHIKDSLGRVKVYYANEESIDLTDGGILECTGEYELKWIGQKRRQD